MDIRKLLIKHAEGSCTPEEREQLILWLQEEGNADLLPEPEELPEMAAAPIMSAAASARILDQVLDTPVDQSPRYRRLLIRYAAAAAVLALAFIGYQWFPRHNAEWVTIHSGYGQISKYTLPDSSSVTLNANATLRYDSLMQSGGAREVWLQGEAFFDVKPASGVFTVHAGDALKVAVLGTQFNVHNNDSTIQVVLNSGRVKVSAAGNDPLVLAPGQMITYHSQDQMLDHQAADTTALTGWKDNVLTFREASLPQIASFIQKHFGVEVVFAQPKLDTLLFTGTAPANDLELFLSILERSLDIKIDKPNNRQIVIRPAH